MESFCIPQIVDTLQYNCDPYEKMPFSLNFFQIIHKYFCSTGEILFL